MYFHLLRNRIITNGSLPRDKRQTSPPPSSGNPTSSLIASPITNGNVNSNIGPKSPAANNIGLGVSSVINMSINSSSSGSQHPPSSPFLPASEADLKSLFGFDHRNGRLPCNYICSQNIYLLYITLLYFCWCVSIEYSKSISLSSTS